MRPQPQRPARPLPTFDLLLWSGHLPPTLSEWASAARLEAADALDAAQLFAARMAWLPVQAWVRGPEGRVELVVVEKATTGVQS